MTESLPDLRQFHISNVKLTGREIGRGSYGSVEEVTIPGAVCAAKRLHGLLENELYQKFVEECRKMSDLRHPHIVQFLGICFLPSGRRTKTLALVMEKMDTSLHEILDPEDPPPTKLFIHASLKCSILHDVTSGLSFLHQHSPPIIHRDLSAKNILLSEGLVAKITDLGMARIVPGLRASTMTMAPGTSIYMPPEALEDNAKYDISIDMFSFGVVALFTLSETFPKPKEVPRTNKKKLNTPNELERREDYMQKIRDQFGAQHPLIELIKLCLKNEPAQRPEAEFARKVVQEARANADDREYDEKKLSLIQILRQNSEFILSKEQQIKEQQQQNRHHKEEIEALRSQIISLEKQIQSLQRQQMQQTVKKKGIKPPIAPKPLIVQGNLVNKVVPLKWPLSLTWREGKDLPTKSLVYASSVSVNGMVYCGDHDALLKYDPENGEWSQLPRPPVKQFTVALLEGRLVLVGGCFDGRIRELDGSKGEWVCRYPPLHFRRGQAVAVGYKKYLIVACGHPYREQVEVLDSSSSKWYRAQPLPLGARQMSSVTLDHCWYLSSFGQWKDGQEHIFCSNLASLVRSALSPKDNMEFLWHELPKPPVAQPTLLALWGNLLSLGGWGFEQDIYRYEVESRQWLLSGHLPIGVEALCCSVLPSGDLMVAGGLTGDTELKSRRMWIGSPDAGNN